MFSEIPRLVVSISEELFVIFKCQKLLLINSIPAK